MVKIDDNHLETKQLRLLIFPAPGKQEMRNQCAQMAPKPWAPTVKWETMEIENVEDMWGLGTLIHPGLKQCRICQGGLVMEGLSWWACHGGLVMMGLSWRLLMCDGRLKLFYIYF